MGVGDAPLHPSFPHVLMSLQQVRGALHVLLEDLHEGESLKFRMVTASICNGGQKTSGAVDGAVDDTDRERLTSITRWGTLDDC